MSAARLLFRALFALAVWLCLVPTAGAGVLSNDTPPFRMAVPDGFEPVPSQIKGDQILAFRGRGVSGAELFVGVDRMRGVLGRDTPADMAKVAGGAAAISTARWKSFDVIVMRSTQSAGAKSVVVYLAQVPLAPEAIQVKVAGPLSSDAELQMLLRTVLAGVDGRSNWLTETERRQKFTQNPLVALLVVMLVGSVLVLPVVAVRWLWRKIRGKTPSSSPSPGGDDPRRWPTCGLVNAPGSPCRRCRGVTAS